MLFQSLRQSILYLLVCSLEFKPGYLQIVSDPIQIASISEIVENIREGRYDLAQEQILKLKDNSKVAEIIHDVYQNKEDSFFDVMKFENSLNRVDITFYVLQALRNEMVANKHLDPLNLVPLAKAFEKDVIFQKNNDETIEAKSKKIISDIKIDVKNSAIEILSEALLANNYLDNIKAKSVAKAIFNFYYDLDDEIMREMVNRTYSRIPAIDIIDALMITSEFIPQKVSVLLAVFEKLKNDNDMDNDAVLLIASSIKLLKDEKNYIHLFPNQKYDVNLMIDKLPACARNLFLADEVCLWSRSKDEYLFPQSTVDPSATERITYTTVPENLKTGEAAWIVEQYFSDFRFKNQLYRKSFLSISMQKPNNLTHYIETRELSNNGFEDRSVWKVELDGEYCFIKNQNIYEYLFASDATGPGMRHYALSAPASAVKSTDAIDFQWQIRDCS